MIRGITRTLLLAGVLAGVLMTSSQAEAGWYHWRGCGPYLGWCGYNYSYCAPTICAPTYCAPTCYTPCYTSCYTSCYTPCCSSYRPCYTGCGLLGRWGYGCRTHHYNYYWGCGLGCYNSCYTPCCSVCGYADCGCGAVEYGLPSDVVPADAVPQEATPADPTVPDQQTSIYNGSALLTVSVPEGTRILVNGMPTQSTGAQRRYVSRNLMRGFAYTYEVKAEMTVDGRPVTQVKTVQLRAGEQAELAFNDSAPASVETALTVHVPADAQVYLAGNETRGSGAVRTFRTTKLAQGASWDDYLVRVVVNENGTPRVKEQKITLQAGEQRELTFDFDISRIAAR